MPNTDTRRVREDYWYTSAQIVEVGRTWATASRDRLFLYSDTVNRTALGVHNAPNLDSLPKKILLPLNKGSDHWVAFVINLTRGQDNSINIRVSYTDSLDTHTKKTADLSSSVKTELGRLSTVLRKKYGAAAKISSSIYPYTWRQPDVASCGPYALANGIRCLEGRKQEANPGRKAIREQQLNMMTRGTALDGCSTNNKVDEILLDWILAQAQASRRPQINKPEQVEAICIYHAHKHGLELGDVVRIFHAEYCSGSENPWYRPEQVNTRILELIAEYGIRLSRPASANSPRGVARNPVKVASSDERSLTLNSARLKPVVKVIGKENLCKKIDDVRVILTNRSQDAVYIFQLMERITLAMLRANHQEAEVLVKEVFTEGQETPECKRCLHLISEVIGMRRYAQDNNEKFIYLANAYKSIADAKQIIRQKEFADLRQPRQLLKAHIHLLQGAIERNSASLIRQISFAINDFCSVLAETLTSGLWVADVTRIERLSQNFKDSEGNLSTEMLKQERASIKTILIAREQLENDPEMNGPRA